MDADPDLPSHSSKTDPINVEEMEYENHVKHLTTESEDAKKVIPCQLDVDYGYSENEKVDILGIDLPDDAPIVIFVHGGYWQLLSRSVSSYVAKGFYNDGFKVMTVGYNLCPNVTLEKIVEEIGSAVTFCLAYAKKIGSRAVAIGGHSAGAHLAASIFMESFDKVPVENQQLVKTVFLISGVYDLMTLIDQPGSEPLKLSEEMAKKLSPMRRPILSKNISIKFILFVGSKEDELFFNQIKEYREKLTQTGYSSDVHVLEGRDHLSIVWGLTDEDYVAVRKIKESLN